MKIFELLIDELDKLTGVDAVALVEEPAMEADFYAFNNNEIEDFIVKEIIEKELFVERMPGEGRDEYIGRCIPVLKKEGYDEDQAAAICYDALKKNFESIVDDGKPLFDTIEEAEKVALELGCEGHHEHEIEGKVWYMPCKEHSDLTDDILEDYQRGESSAETFAKHGSNAKYTFALDKEQQMVVGPLMIPDKLIFRLDEQGEPYYVFFSQDTIKQIAQKMMKDKHIDSVNLEHNPDNTVDGYMVSTWIVEDEMKDKQQVYGFNYPAGTWFGQYKIEDMSVWEKVKAGEIKGFSVEGFFADKFVQAKKQH